jgi:hypothetical protein
MFALIREAIHDLISELRTALSGREQAGERDVNDQEGRIADVSRTPFFIFGLLGGGMTIVAVAASLYAYFNTPEIIEVAVYKDGRLSHRESKFVYLFILVLFQLAVLWVTVSPLIKWEKVVRKSREPRDVLARFANITSVRFAQIVIAVFCAFGAASLWALLSRCSYVLNQT